VEKLEKRKNFNIFFSAFFYRSTFVFFFSFKIDDDFLIEVKMLLSDIWLE
jgi:hypothetical protein